MIMLASLTRVLIGTVKRALYASSYLHSHLVNRQIIVSTMFIAILLSSTPILILHLRAQSEDSNITNLRRPTTTRVVPVNYTTVTSSNELSLYEIPPNISKAASSDKNISAPLVVNPSYTVTNATVTFGTDILTSNRTQNELNVFIANTSEALINATS
jgi:hypothetical protein